MPLRICEVCKQKTLAHVCELGYVGHLMAQKLSKVVDVKTCKIDEVLHRSNGDITINYKQRHDYSLDCGHMASEVVFIGKQPKMKMKCKVCAQAVQS